MWETPAIRPHEEEIPWMGTGGTPFGGDGESLYRQLPAEDIHSPITDSEALTARNAGRDLYATYCIHCHGKYHDGNGTVGQSFAPLPGNLRSVKVQTMAEGFLFKEISYGIPNGRQPALATTIAVEDRWKIIAYIKSLGVQSAP